MLAADVRDRIAQNFSCGEIPNNIPYLARFNSPVYLLRHAVDLARRFVNTKCTEQAVLDSTEIAPSLETDEITSFGFQQPGLQVDKQLTTIIDSEVLSKRSV